MDILSPMLARIDKRALLEAVVDQLAEAVADSTARARATAASATHEEARPEDAKDTRALEETYLARGQAARVAELQLDLATLRHLELQSFEGGRAAAATALIRIEDADGAPRVVFLVPRAGGRKLTFGGVEISLTTPASPLGRKLVGSEVDDEIQLVIKGRTRVWSVIEVT